MEKVTAVLATRVLQEKLTPIETSKKASVLPEPPNEQRQRDIIRIIMEVELVKMINPPLTPQQRNALMRLLNATGLPLDELARVGQRVIEKTTYGNIAFEHWKSEMDFSGINNRLPDTELDRYCVDCNANHKWDELCPQLDGTDPRPYTERQ